MPNRLATTALISDDTVPFISFGDFDLKSQSLKELVTIAVR